MIGSNDNNQQLKTNRDQHNESVQRPNFSFDGKEIGNMAANGQPNKNSYDSEVPRDGFFDGHEPRY
jgi:hypothetical protein